jgi:hypothetical protein
VGWLTHSAVKRPPASPLMAFTIAPPDQFFFEPALTRQDFAISPDGERLAFVASNASQSQLWIREIRSLRNYALAPERNVRGVVWSPDSRFVYFDERTTVRRVSTDGGVAQTICELPPGPPWMGLLQRADGLVLYTRGGSYRVPAAGGSPHPIDAAPYSWVETISEDRILQVQYDRRIHRDKAIVENLTGSKEKQVVVESDSRVQYAPPAAGERTGHLLYVRAGSLIAHPFDAGTMQPAGEPIGRGIEGLFFRAN